MFENGSYLGIICIIILEGADGASKDRRWLG